MNPKDTPIARFSAFWWTVAVFGVVGVGVGGLKLANKYIGDRPTDLEEHAAVARIKKREAVDAAQQANFAYKAVEEGKTVQVPPHDVFAYVGKNLVSQKPTAVKNPAQVVLGSPTHKTILETPPAVDIKAAIKAVDEAAKAPVDPTVMEAGKAKYATCLVCHGAEGNGQPMLAPPLAGSEWVNGPISNLIRIQFRGLTGPITVKGVKHELPAPMAPMGAADDDASVAAVLTYIRNSFGNKASAVTADQVKALRSEIGQPALTEADLVKP